MTFSPAKLSQPQIIIILKIFRDFFACKIVLTANHFYPENFQKLFGLQNCLSRKSSLSWNYSKTFRLQNRLSRKSSSSWKFSRSFPPAKLSSTQITIILKTFKDFFDRNFVLDANHHYPGNIQNFFSRKLSWPQIIFILKLFKIFLACKIVLDANHHYPEIIQRFFGHQKCLSLKSSLSWKYLETFSPANLS